MKKYGIFTMYLFIGLNILIIEREVSATIGLQGVLNMENVVNSNSADNLTVSHYPNAHEEYNTATGDVLFLDPINNSSIYSDCYGIRAKTDVRPEDSVSDFNIKLVYNGTLDSDVSNYLELNLFYGLDWEFGDKPILFQSNLLPYGPVVDIRKAIAQNSGNLPLINLLAGTYTSSTPYGEGVLTIGTRKLADLSDNGDINLEDFAMLAEDWQKPQGQYVGDITGEFGIPDGYVDMWDLVEFVSHWLE